MILHLQPTLITMILHLQPSLINYDQWWMSVLQLSSAASFAYTQDLRVCTVVIFYSFLCVHTRSTCLCVLQLASTVSFAYTQDQRVCTVVSFYSFRCVHTRSTCLYCSYLLHLPLRTHKIYVSVLQLASAASFAYTQDLRVCTCRWCCSSAYLLKVCFLSCLKELWNQVQLVFCLLGCILFLYIYYPICCYFTFFQGRDNYLSSK